MKTSPRALAAVALLAGFPLLVVVLVAGIVTVEVYALFHSPIWALAFGVIAVPSLGVLLKTVLILGRPPREEPGLRVLPEEQPELWNLVRELADEIGRRAPDRIFLTADANAGVLHENHLFRPSQRQLLLGALLLSAFRLDQLRAVLAHELTHYDHGQWSRAATYRWHRSLSRTVLGLDHARGLDWFVRPLLQSYAKAYFAVSARVRRDAEFAADLGAVRLAGTAAAVSALRESEGLAEAWGFFLDNYAAEGWAAGYFPARLAEGYRALLADDWRKREIADVRKTLAKRKTARFDHHPATPERIAALETAPAVAPPAGGDGPAYQILRDAEEFLDTALLTGLVDEVSTKERTDWDTLAGLGAHHTALGNALGVLGGRTLGDALDMIDTGEATPLAAPGFTVPAGAAPEVRRAMVGAAIRRRLSLVVTAALADAGVVRWRVSWSGPAEIVVDGPGNEAVSAALDAACTADPDTTPLRVLLKEAEVPLDYRPSRSTALG
ncbi:M48 family metallopeptidase [Amycolatopsis rhabdoformis]|uniref:M48 family metallopeptidase n=1 Tax=Amycolatopsis rhabdoformis TaxID=1448059 RepID=A0ABZ1I0B3_9PSEU|nr:M48 family metallopeptidase [Amycolatopsis rhabdoformis]WSE27852.1 M48 family metallopeptidase [Amycolatopsis rhabdoformis]